MKTYSLIWIITSPESEIGQDLSLQKDVYLPYFLEGNQEKVFEEKDEDVEVGPENLLKGILIGYKEKYPFGNHEFSISYFRKLAVLLIDFFDYASLEEMLLNVLLQIKIKHGDITHLKALQGAQFIAGHNSKITFNLCNQTYLLILNENSFPKEEGIEILKENLPLIVKGEIDPKAIPFYDKMFEFLRKIS
ncbi:hypothetical protein [Algoriphagus formosus]|uniref:hypothetical protein n=1 Tax=Algoriphagus formosus TaxID=2007308 RepID=UPI000C291AF0|nr:hypothetical protein [Algoriphagus formosus]